MTADAGDKTNARPLLRRQLDALADWLAKDLWTVEQAACLLVGVLPDEDRQKWLPVGEVRRGYGSCLPGREAWPAPDAWHWDILAEIEEMESRLSPLAKLGRVKRVAIMREIEEADDLPPWWQAAKEDPVCAAYLPKGISTLSSHPPINQLEDQAPEWLKAARSKGGRITVERLEGRAEQRDFVREKIIEGLTNKAILDMLAAKFTNAYVDGAEKNWIPEIRKETGIRRGRV